MDHKISICIAGDLVPTKTNYHIFENGSLDDLLGEKLASIWDSADFRIANLEAPIIDNGMPILKEGPNICIPEKMAAGLKTLNLNMVGLSNNHIKDYGTEGIKNTEKVLQRFEIDYIGIGDDSRSANQGKVHEIYGLKVGFYACSEHEFSAAKFEVAGANAIGVDTSLRIHEIKKRCDYEIVLFHGGKEHYPYPTPMQQERCRSFIDAGADIVICQHSHCVGCEEKYGNGTIVYGQGNFIFDYKKEECWKAGVLIEITLQKNEELAAQIVYHPICKKGHTISYADDRVAEKISEDFRKRSSEICTVRGRYMEIVDGEGAYKLRLLAGWNKTKRGIDRFLCRNRWIKAQYSKKKTAGCLGIMNCETSREIVIDYLNKMAKES